ncbi:hypothetical protein R3P38DRAFT_2567186 [Favolaschia claudopus]|uniref:F-box domain-containing protein n=1 Tax=Favolaschia claudopus TaxID=2862362 RepID=A0AAV9ZX22_9AGAR
MACIDPAPTLPLDVEREIFETLAFSSPQYISKIMLVAQRVKTWTEPVLYRSLIISTVHMSAATHGTRTLSLEDFLELLDRKPATFFRDSVRFLALKLIPFNVAPRILNHCSRVTHLALFSMWTDPSWLSAIKKMPLLEISAGIDGLLNRTGDLYGPGFQGLTHLNLHDPPSANGWVDGLCSLPLLTHLSFNDENPPRNTECREILSKSKSLRVLVLLVITDDQITTLVDGLGFECFADDVRSVITIDNNDVLEDWRSGAIGGENYWVRSERLVQKRRSGEVSGTFIYILWRSNMQDYDACIL